MRKLATKSLSCSEQLAKQLLERLLFWRRQRAERLAENLLHDLGTGPTHTFALRRQLVAYGTPPARDSLDQAPSLHPTRQSPERLIGLKRQLGKGVERRARILM